MANQITINNVKLSIGDVVGIYQTIKEKDKEKSQAFEGRVISIKGREPNKTFTVRKIGADKVGVEKIFPALSPLIAKIEIKKSIPERRAKLYFLRDKKS